jgi:two-component system NarL family sensor kinase
LHNGLGQLLFGVKLHLDQVGDENTVSRPESSEALETSKVILAECIQESRRIAHHLMPAILSDFGLKEAILDVCRTLSTNVKFNCKIEELIELDKQKEIVIYRSTQELILNVVKHADATKCTVKITADKNTITVTIDDNGKGFSHDYESRKGIGLSTIRSRVTAYNGNLIITSKPFESTMVTMSMPLNSK